MEKDFLHWAFRIVMFFIGIWVGSIEYRLRKTTSHERLKDLKDFLDERFSFIDSKLNNLDQRLMRIEDRMMNGKQTWLKRS